MTFCILKRLFHALADLVPKWVMDFIWMGPFAFI